MFYAVFLLHGYMYMHVSHVNCGAKNMPWPNGISVLIYANLEQRAGRKRNGLLAASIFLRITNV